MVESPDAMKTGTIHHENISFTYPSEVSHNFSA
jgi:hypothetical protein